MFFCLLKLQRSFLRLLEITRHVTLLEIFDDLNDNKLGFISLSQRLYKEKGVNDQHSYTITSERPEITQAKINAANFSEVLNSTQ